MTQLWRDVMTQLQPKSPDDVTAQLFRFVPPAALCVAYLIIKKTEQLFRFIPPGALCFDDLFPRGRPYLIIAVHVTSD